MLHSWKCTKGNHLEPPFFIPFPSSLNLHTFLSARDPFQGGSRPFSFPIWRLRNFFFSWRLFSTFFLQLLVLLFSWEGGGNNEGRETRYKQRAGREIILEIKAELAKRGLLAQSPITILLGKERARSRNRDKWTFSFSSHSSFATRSREEEGKKILGLFLL